MFTNINLLDGDKTYNYVIEYSRDDNQIDHHDSFYYIEPDFRSILFSNNGREYIQKNNYWYQASDMNMNKTHIPSQPTLAKFSLYFPDYSADTYHENIKYAITVKTWIHGVSITLFSDIIRRSDALACERAKKFENNNYYEKIDFLIIDPYKLTYSDDWSEFRQGVCGEPLTNNTGSILYVSIHPVIDNEIGFIKYNQVIGGQNSLNLTKDVEDFLNLNISTNISKPLTGRNGKQPSIVCKLKFNKEYNNDLRGYLRETYGLSEYKIQYRLVVGNKNDLYAIIDSELVKVPTYIFKKDVICQNNFTNGDGWKPGIFIVCSADIINEQNESVISILSNKIPLTPEVFSYFVNSDKLEVNGVEINNVKLNLLDMNLLNINAVNKIENKIIQLDTPDDSKSSIIQPVFFRVSELSNIVIHNEVTETICLNLDRYKSQVKTFILQIEGVKFQEVGKTKQGVLFKIIGHQLPVAKTTGTYYILNETYELITSGKYNYA